MDERTTKLAIKAALMASAIAAIWYVWEIFTFSSLSESDAKLWLRYSEVLLVVSAILLTGGLLGEWPDSESWKKRLLYKLSKGAVIIGVVGELLGDGGIFAAGDRVESLDNAKIVGLDKKIKEDQDLILWLLTPRQLGQIEECKKILAQSPSHPAIKMVWRSDVSDGETFAFFIGACVRAEGTAVTDFPKAAERTGITVISNQIGAWWARPKSPGDFVASALSEGVIPKHMGVSAKVDPSLPDGQVIIAIGPKQ